MLPIKMLHDLKIPEGIRIPYFGGKYNACLDLIIQQIAVGYAQDYTKLKKLRNNRHIPIVVSLTSFPARISTVHICISMLLRQTVAPDRILLWLASSQVSAIPRQLEDLTKFGVEIRICDEDLKGHKKYYYTMQEIKNGLIITVDDDLIFPEDTIEKLYNTYLYYPHCIICNRAQEIQLDEQGRIQPYAKWKVLSKRENVPSLFYMASTGAGTLYPPGLLAERVLDKQIIKQYCLSADDIWMKTMSLLKGTEVVKTRRYHQPLTTITDSQKESLAIENIFGGKNNQCVTALQQLYPEAFQRLRDMCQKFR